MKLLILLMLAILGVLSIWIFAALEMYKTYKIGKIKNTPSVSLPTFNASTPAKQIAKQMMELVSGEYFFRNVLTNHSANFDDDEHRNKYNRFISNPLVIDYIQNAGVDEENAALQQLMSNHIKNVKGK